MFEFLKGVRDNAVHQKAVFLILSLEPGVVGARSDRSASSAGILLRADGYMIMPVFDADALAARIKKLQPAVPALQQCKTAEEKRQAE